MKGSSDIPHIAWLVEVTDELRDWFNGLTEAKQESVDTAVGLLKQFGPNPSFPYSSGIAISRHSHMRELRIQHHGRPYRVLYAFDPRRSAVLLIGGDKTGDNRWYKRFVPKADTLYDEYLEDIQREGLI